MNDLAFLTFAAELGDKSFFLTLLLTAWCPLTGIRRGNIVSLQQCLVAAGAFLALYLRYYFEAYFFLHVVQVRVWCTRGSALVLLLLASLSSVHLWRGRGRKTILAALETGSGSSCRSSRDDPQRRNASMKRAGGFLGDFEPYDPSTYTGAALESQQDEKNPFAPGAEPAAEDWLNNSSSVSRRSRNYGYGSTIAAFSMERSEESDLTLLLAFAIPLVSIFLVESGDKSIGLLIDRLTSTNKSHGLLTVSAVLFAGYLPAISFACFIGFFMERQLSESRLLIVTTAGTCALALVACSAALVQEIAPAAGHGVNVDMLSLIARASTVLQKHGSGT